MEGSKKEKTTFGKWLEQKYIEWMSDEGGYRQQNEFAKWLDVDPTLISHYMNDRRKPNEETAEKIAARLGPETYIALGEVPPDLKKELTQIPPEYYADVMKIVREFLLSKGFKRTK